MTQQNVPFPAMGGGITEPTARIISVIDTGFATSPSAQGTNVLNDNTKDWPANIFAGLVVEVIDGAGKGQARLITGNSTSSVTTQGNWIVALDTTSRYRIISPADHRQAMRDVFGGGANISAANPLQVYDPKVGSLISYDGTTTANGAGGGTTLVCAGLATQPDFDGALVIVTSGAYSGQSRQINGATTGGTVTFDAAVGGQIAAGVTFKIVASRYSRVQIATLAAAVAALAADTGDASASTLGSLYGILGNPAQSFLAMVGYEGATSLAGKLTAARAANLDNCSYLEQTVPILMNSTQTLTNAQGDKDFIASNATGASGLVSIDDTKVQRVMLLIIGRAVNTFAGTNAIDCTTATHNQWQINLDGGAYSDLVNEEADGQMLDNDWRCPVEGAIHPFTFMFLVTSQVTNIDGKIGIRLQNGRSEQTNLIVTLDIYLKVVFKL